MTSLGPITTFRLVGLVLEKRQTKEKDLSSGKAFREEIFPSTHSPIPLFPKKISRMKHLFLFIALYMASLPALGQTEKECQRRMWDDAFMQLQGDSISPDSLSLAGQKANTLSLPWNQPSATNLGSFGLGGYYDGYGWRLHEGFNAQFGMSLTAGLGKHAPRGVGFGQTAAFAYVAPITPKLSVAIGLTADNFDWGAWRQTSVGIGGVVAYQVNDNISLYAYGQKSFLPRQSLYSQWRRGGFPLWYDIPRDRFGAAAEFKIGRNAMIGVSVERRSY